jgi:curved DNA-binding protein CbpA
MSSVRDCLKEIKVSTESLEQCATLSQEFNIIKKAYFKQCLQTHPDKGGDEADFRKLNSCFEILRSIFDAGSTESFLKLSESYDPFDVNIQSFDFYAHAAEELVPTYLVELARSKRSKCVMKKCEGKDILKGEISKLVL